MGYGRHLLGIVKNAGQTFLYVGRFRRTTLHANWAYMVCASLAWSLKAWFAMTLPTSPRWQAKHRADAKRILTMEFRTFVDRFILAPAQVLQSGRRFVVRFLAWRRDLHVLFRALDGLLDSS